MVGPPKKKEDENSWRSIIEDTPLNDDQWSVKVIILESAGSEHDQIYLNKFEVFALQERRFVIKNISKTETIFMINQLGAEKKVKDPSLRVFEEGQSYLKEHKVIPPDVLALIIKHLILKMKTEYLFIKQQRLEVQLGINDEMDIMFDKPEVRNLTITKSAKNVEVDSPQPPSKNKATNNEMVNPIPQNDKKYDTYLRVRGEEWRDKVYVDDFPIDGPNIYVAVTGFAESELAGCLVNIGVPLTAVVQIRIDPTETKVPSLLTRMTKRGQNPTESQVEKIQQYWEEIQQIRIQKETSDALKDTAFFIFTPPYWESEDLSGEDEKIYDEVCYLLYDIQDLYRQHAHYLDNMEITDVPFEIPNEQYQSQYQKLLYSIPHECNTIYLIVDSILQTVCNDWDSERISSITVVETENFSKKDNMNEHVEKTKNIMDQVFNMLCKTDVQNKSYRSTYGEEYESLNDPIIIKYGDDAKAQTFHLENLNLEKIVLSSLYCMPTNLLWQNQSRPVIEIEAKINFHVNVLLSCFKRRDVETAELNRLIHILAFRKLYNNRSSIKQKHALPSTLKEFKKRYLKRSILAEPIPVFSSVLHFPSTVSSFPSITKSEHVSSESSSNQEKFKINLLFMCPDLMELVSASEIATNKPQNNIIDDYEYFEDLTDITCFQTILKAFNSYNCVDYKYCDVTDCLLMMFHNSYNKDGISYREWRSHLPTPLCLQDFFDFVFEENYEWIKNEEILYEAEFNLNLKPDSKNVVNVSPVDCCLQNSYTMGPEFLIEGSLKHADLQKAEESIDDDPSKRSNASFADTINTKSTQKTKTTVNSQKNTKNVAPSSVCSELSEILIRKPFLGYNLSDRRVEVFGKDSTYFSKYGTKVNCSYTFLIPMNLEYLSLCLVPGNRNIEFLFHNAFGKLITQETKNKCDSFRITNGDQVMINISKKTYNKKRSIEDLMLIEEPIQKDLVNLPQSYFDFVMTWPNGLITESVFENDSSRISHIKQFFSTPLSNLEEEMRCISMNGEVIVFKFNGFVEVLRPDGSYITIKKCHKKPINANSMSNELDKDSSSFKKGKDKNKQLNSIKLSKQNLNEREKSEIKLVKYELNINEFELIESKGVRELWIENNRFFLEKLLIRTTTDYNTGEIFSRRMDGTHTLLNKDGIYVVSFPDKTRIVTKYVVEDFEIYPEWTEEEIEYFELISNGHSNTEKNESQSVSNMNVSNVIDEHLELNPDERFDGYVSIQLIYIIEHINLTTITINKASDKITVESPNETAITINGNNRYDIHVDSVTNATFDGTDLIVKYGACTDFKSETTCTVKINSIDSSTTRLDHQWLEMRDSVDKKIVVNGEGIISILDDISNEDILPNNDEEKVDDFPSEKKSESSTDTPDKCIETYQAKEMRFFVLKRDLSCSELIHRELVESYKKDCRLQPWCSITQHNTFGDHRILHSILSPIHVNETEKWLMRSKFTVKPVHLKYKDLKKECGKGFYHWMRPYGRFKPKPITAPDVLPPRTPPAFILRTLEQQWRDKDRENLKGARELIEAVLKYRKIMEDDSETSLNIPIIDARSDDEKNTDDLIQALGERIYKNLKMKVEEDILSRVKADITTKPPHTVDSGTVEAEREMSVDEMSDKASLLDEAEAAEVMSPNLKAYWRRRVEELKEENYYLYLLRNPSIPPYFLNVLGGAIWWEMNNLTDEAVTKSERMKMMCLCLDENSSISPNKETEELG